MCSRMSPPGRTNGNVVWAGLFSAGFAAIAMLSPRPRLMWNASASAPVGLYRLDTDARPRLGDLVAIAPPAATARMMAERHYLPIGVPLMKHVAALPGQQVCRVGAAVSVDGRPAAVAETRDRLGRALPSWQGCRRVRTDELFLLNAAPDSLDGRYFGALPAAGLIGTAHPILTRDAPDQPLRWRGLGASAASPTTNQEPRP